MAEIWFNEGWATWWARYWTNKQNDSATTVEQRSLSNYDPRQPTRWNTAPAALPGPADLFDTFPVYTRPALMLEGYRQIVGDTAFFAFQRLMLTEHGYSGISIAEFIALAKRVAQERGGFEASNLRQARQVLPAVAVRRRASRR